MLKKSLKIGDNIGVKQRRITVAMRGLRPVSLNDCYKIETGVTKFFTRCRGISITDGDQLSAPRDMIIRLRNTATADSFMTAARASSVQQSARSGLARPIMIEVEARYPAGNSNENGYLMLDIDNRLHIIRATAYAVFNSSRGSAPTIQWR